MKRLFTFGVAGLFVLSTLTPSLAFDQRMRSAFRLWSTRVCSITGQAATSRKRKPRFKGITLHGRYDVVEQAFAEAATLAPERIDFLFDVASSNPAEEGG